MEDEDEEDVSLSEMLDFIWNVQENCMSETDGQANFRAAKPVDDMIAEWDLEKGPLLTTGLIRYTYSMKVLLPHWDELLQRAYKKWPDKSLFVGLID